MRLTTKGRYAVTAMLDLALNANQRPVSLADISDRQHISLSYLEQLFAKLRRKKLVNSVRGPGGGYQVANSLSHITIAEIIDAVDESVNAKKCDGVTVCQGSEPCLTHYLWHDLDEKIHEFLANITLNDLVNRREIKELAVKQVQPKSLKSNINYKIDALVIK